MVLKFLINLLKKGIDIYCSNKLPRRKARITPQTPIKIQWHDRIIIRGDRVEDRRIEKKENRDKKPESGAETENDSKLYSKVERLNLAVGNQY